MAYLWLYDKKIFFWPQDFLQESECDMEMRFQAWFVGMCWSICLESLLDSVVAHNQFVAGRLDKRSHAQSEEKASYNEKILIEGACENTRNNMCEPKWTLWSRIEKGPDAPLSLSGQLTQVYVAYPAEWYVILSFEPERRQTLRNRQWQRQCNHKCTMI